MDALQVTASVSRAAQIAGLTYDIRSGDGLRNANSRVVTKKYVSFLGPVEPIRLSWEDLEYSVVADRGRHGKQKFLLKEVSGYVLPGNLTAIMGSSGCGKSTLLNALAGRLPRPGVLTGKILVNGLQPSARGHLSDIMEYVRQEDNVFFQSLTAHETLMIGAEFYYADRPATRQEVVRSTLEAIGMTQVTHTRVAALSGGQKRRLHVGLKLLSNPSVLLLDEPTSGLDATQAERLVQLLSDIAKAGRTVVAVIHQPRNSIFSMMDKLYLMSEGHVMFAGSPQLAEKLFDGLGFECPMGLNVADFLLDLISVNRETPEAEKLTTQRILAFADLHRNESDDTKHACCSSVHRLNGSPLAANEAVSTGGANSRMQHRVGLAGQLKTLTKRSALQAWGNMAANIMTLCQAVVIAILLALCYANSRGTTGPISNTAGALFMISGLFFILVFQYVYLGFPVEKHLVHPEVWGKTYTLAPYFLSKILVELPVKGVPVLVGSAIAYWGFGFTPGASQFFIYLLTMLLAASGAISMGLAIGAAVPNVLLAAAMAPIFNTLTFACSGFIISIDSFPGWLAWITAISPMRWVYQALVINNFAGQTGWQCNSSLESSQCVMDGDQFLAAYGYNDSSIWEALVWLAVLSAAYYLAALAALILTKPRFLRPQPRDDDTGPTSTHHDKSESPSCDDRAARPGRLSSGNLQMSRIETSDPSENC